MPVCLLFFRMILYLLALRSSLSITEFAQVLPALPPHSPQATDAFPFTSFLLFRLSAGVLCLAKKLLILLIVSKLMFFPPDKSLALATPTNVPPLFEGDTLLLLSKATRAAFCTAFGGIGTI